MTKTFEAIYEMGVLRPLAPLEGVAEREKVTVSIDTCAQPNDLLPFCGTLSDVDAREIEQIISAEFEKVDSNEWR